MTQPLPNPPAAPPTDAKLLENHITKMRAKDAMAESVIALMDLEIFVLDGAVDRVFKRAGYTPEAGQ